MDNASAHTLRASRCRSAVKCAYPAWSSARIRLCAAPFANQLRVPIVIESRRVQAWIDKGGADVFEHAAEAAMDWPLRRIIGFDGRATANFRAWLSARGN